MINYYRVKIKRNLSKPLTYSELLKLLNISCGLLNYHLNILRLNNEIKSSENIRNNRKIVVYEKCD
jgi:predicted transcriptional regulator